MEKQREFWLLPVKNTIASSFIFQPIMFLMGTQQFPIKKMHLANPQTVYGASKLEGEKQAIEFNPGFNHHPHIMGLFCNSEKIL